MKAQIKNQLKMALMVGPMNELEARLDQTLEDLFPENGHRVTEDDLNKARKLLFYWQTNPSDNFASRVFDLMGKADPINTRNLMRGFPVECQVWSEWFESKDPDALFRSWGFK